MSKLKLIEIVAPKPSDVANAIRESGNNKPQPIPTGKFTIEKLDASIVNVYTGADAVILIFDPTKKWTWDYVRKEIEGESIPHGIPVLIIVTSQFDILIILTFQGNYRDMNPHRIVSEKEIESFLDLSSRAQSANECVKYIEASMLNSFGLRGIVSFFNIPFLK
jgi:hypothetical protein